MLTRITTPSISPLCLHIARLMSKEFKLPTEEEFLSSQRSETSISQHTVVGEDGVRRHYKTGKIYVPKALRETVMYWYHGSRYSGHCGVQKSLRKMKKQIWWENMGTDVQEFIGRCAICICMRTKPTGQGIRNSLIKPEVFDMVCLDFIGPRQWFGRAFRVLAAVDSASRYMMNEVVEKERDISVIRFLREKWVPVFGKPRVVLTDRGRYPDAKVETCSIVVVLPPRERAC